MAEPVTLPFWGPSGFHLPSQDHLDAARHCWAPEGLLQ